MFTPASRPKAAKLPSPYLSMNWAYPGMAKRGADGWVVLRHPRCLLRDAGIGDGSFAPLRGAMPV